MVIFSVMDRTFMVELLKKKDIKKVQEAPPCHLETLTMRDGLLVSAVGLLCILLMAAYKIFAMSANILKTVSSFKKSPEKMSNHWNECECECRTNVQKLLENETNLLQKSILDCGNEEVSPKMGCSSVGDTHTTLISEKRYSPEVDIDHLEYEANIGIPETSSNYKRRNEYFDNEDHSSQKCMPVVQSLRSETVRHQEKYLPNGTSNNYENGREMGKNFETEFMKMIAVSTSNGRSKIPIPTYALSGLANQRCYMGKKLKLKASLKKGSLNKRSLKIVRKIRPKMPRYE